MKITFQMVVFNGDFVLKECLESILPYGDVVVTEGPVKFFADRGFTTSTDNTNDILHTLLCDESIVHGQWSEKDEMMHAVESLIERDSEYVWMVDSDEVWKPKDIETIIKVLQEDVIDSMAFKPYSFYGPLQRYIGGFERKFEWHRIQRWYPGARWHTHRPPTVLAPDGKPWRDHLHLNHELTNAMGLNFYHYSHVFPSQVKAKTEYYEGRGGCIEDYFSSVWLPWVTGSREQIENKYNGVQEWLPERRGESRTRDFTGEHPESIVKAMPRLMARFNAELSQWA